MPQTNNKVFWIGFSRGFGGALIFAFPLFMTMEMWWLGFYLDAGRVLIFLLLSLPILFGLSYFSGFEATADWQQDLIDALIAVLIGVVSAGVILALLAVLTIDMPLNEIVGKLAMLTVPASMGAVLASKQLGQQDRENEDAKQGSGYWGELFIMGVGAMFIAFNVAPTEEMVLLAYKMTAWHATALVLFSIGVMHGIVYSLGFRGQESGPRGASSGHLFMHYTLAGYVLALLTSGYMLWIFGRFDGVALAPALICTIVLGFPASLGAAVSRLVV